MSVNNSRARWGFGAITVVGVLLIVWSGIRNGQSSSEVSKQLSGISTEITRIASAAKVNPNQSMNDLANDIIKRLSPPVWNLTDNQKQELIRYLDSIPSSERFRFEIGSIPSNSQSTIFMSDLVSLFNSANWNVSGTNDFSIRPDIVGLYIGCADPEKPPEAAKKLMVILNYTGIAAGYGSDPQYSGDNFELIVGLPPS